MHHVAWPFGSGAVISLAAGSCRWRQVTLADQALCSGVDRRIVGVLVARPSTYRLSTQNVAAIKTVS